MKTTSVAIVLLLLPGGWSALPARVAGEPTGVEQLLQHARRSARHNAQVLALEFFLRALEMSGGDRVSPQLRRQVIEDMLSTCRALDEQGRKKAAVRCLLALLEPTRAGSPISGAQAASLRLRLEKLALHLVLAHQYTQAIAALRALCADSPGGAMRWALLARAQMESGAGADADQTIRRGLKLHPGAPELLFIRALRAAVASRQSVIRGRFAEVERLLRRAAADLDRAASQQRGMSGIWLSLAKVRSELYRLLRVTGRPSQAEELAGRVEDAYTRVILSEPRHTDAVVALADFLLDSGDWREARKWYTEALRRSRGAAAERQRKLRAKLLDSWLEGVRRETLAGRPGRALVLLRQAGPLFPGKAELLNLTRGWVERRGAGKRPAESLPPDDSTVTTIRAGQLLAVVEAAPSFDSGMLEQLLPRALAFNLALFPNRLYGPLSLKIFASAGEFRAQAAAGERLDVCRAGRALTWEGRGRGRRDWLELLTRELAHRFIDELSYGRAPLWIYEGLSGWVARPPGRVDKLRLRWLARRDRLVSWRALDQALRWPHSLQRRQDLHLQSRQMVDWLLSRYGRERLLVLLAALRAESPLPQAVRHIFGHSLEQLERDWRRQLVDAGG